MFELIPLRPMSSRCNSSPLIEVKRPSRGHTVEMPVRCTPHVMIFHREETLPLLLDHTQGRGKPERSIQMYRSAFHLLVPQLRAADSQYVSIVVVVQSPIRSDKNGRQTLSLPVVARTLHQLLKYPILTTMLFIEVSDRIPLCTISRFHLDHTV